MQVVQMILANIPWWVYGILAYGVWMGIQAFRQRTLSILTVGILPLVFLGLTVPSLWAILDRFPLVGVLWLLCLCLGYVLGWYFLYTRLVSADRQKGKLTVGGTWVVLVLFFAIFVVKFAYGYESAVDPEFAAQPAFLVTIFGLSGVSAGIMIGRAIRLLNDYNQAPQTRTV